MGALAEQAEQVSAVCTTVHGRVHTLLDHRKERLGSRKQEKTTERKRKESSMYMQSSLMPSGLAWLKHFIPCIYLHRLNLRHVRIHIHMP